VWIILLFSSHGGFLSSVQPEGVREWCTAFPHYNEVTDVHSASAHATRAT